VKIPGVDLSDPEEQRRWSKSLEQLARLLKGSQGEGGAEETPDAMEMLKAAGLLDVEPPPAGWLGCGLSFSGSIVRKPSNGVPVRWQFDSPPKVVSVEADGPADRAGLKRGDVLTQIDGVPLDSGRGEKRFSAIEPGQTITWTVRRDGVERTIVMVAEERPRSDVAGTRPKSD